MKALTWQGKRDVRVEQVDDPRIELPTDAIVRVTSTAICGSDLHLYEVLGPFLSPGDILGHETMGVVEEVGAEVTHVKPGDRVVIPFNISCGHCWMCSRGLFAQCETTQNQRTGKGASLFGYTELYGSVPGGQAEYLRVPQAQFGPIKVPDEGPDEKFLFLSDILPTAWQAVKFADLSEGDTVAVLGLGPVGPEGALSVRSGPTDCGPLNAWQATRASRYIPHDKNAPRGYGTVTVSVFGGPTTPGAADQGALTVDYGSVPDTYYGGWSQPRTTTVMTGPDVSDHTTTSATVPIGIMDGEAPGFGWRFTTRDGASYDVATVTLTYTYLTPQG
ncbi:alcohol dehydrogenase catalytic domain-containing protein [Nocardioides panacis]|uniref:Alcohol dehydrogenase catalytic domain-containing protein n=1 Tax=Nocardioides panacis TaxID=2849501 RepID=A0A975SZ80_9ACTN|nr:alcohol dehydrogenase catalytic domain-containing protein [Nocardioides panacis]QWZ08669.1 alcohol dehydrogenase catalytic domain-containing protein [Nocardioides panacis]